jgi:DNA mismatch endonuclease, patch repair protein
MKRKRTVPSFVGLKPASAWASRVKQRNFSRNTTQEVLLRKELRKFGVRFRRNVASLPGRPDFVFSEARLAVFCDGDFWHGRRWRALSRKLTKGTNGEYWCAKIGSNIQRDKRNTKLLKKLGWSVVRLWESETKKNPALAARSIVKLL